MEIVETRDKSKTLLHPKYGETFHSVTGAIEEAREKFVKPCKIAEKAEKELFILDICFGLGYNSAVALEVARQANPNCVVKITALENSLDVIEKIKNLDPKIDRYKEVLDKVDLYLGDARQTIKKINQKFDAVFLDPFSPKACPELWTKGFFEDIRKLMKKDAILATYSCAKLVRDNLKAAGFKAEDGPCVGRRGPSTVARIDKVK